MKICFSDLETANSEPISSGSYKYGETVRVQLWAYAIDDSPVEIWDIASGEPIPKMLKAALVDEDVRFCWHNQMFDRIQLRSLGIELPYHRVIDTMVMAYRLALPGSLDKLGEVLGLSEELAKITSGKNHVLRFCKPDKNGRWADHNTHPKEWAEYKEYAKRDVVAMREILRRMSKFHKVTDFERMVWMLDQRINDRGFRVDIDLVDSALALADKEREVLANDARNLSDGAVSSTTRRDALLTFIREEYQVDVKDLRGSTITKLLEDDSLDPTLRSLLLNRVEAASTSVSKYKRIRQMICVDGRIRGTLQYHAAVRTGRWGGRGIQPQNLPRPVVKPWALLDEYIEAIKRGDTEFPGYSTMDVLSSALRGTIIAPPGRKLVVSDLSAIEGRVTAWLAGESWRVEAFREFDRNGGVDDYCMTYAKAFNRDATTITEDERQIGKVMSLFFGYGGSVGAFVSGAATYHLDLDELARQAESVIPDDVLRDSYGFLEWAKENKLPRYALSDSTYVICHALVKLWRSANPRTVTLWRDPEFAQNGLEGAARCSVSNKHERIRCRKVAFISDDFATYMELPSGRRLAYPKMRVDEGTGELTYLGTNQYTRRWERIRTYGGKLLENCAQAVARDILANGMLLAEEAGYEVVLTVHDEIISETTDSEEFSADGLSSLMATQPSWALDLPLASKGFETYRYRK